MGRKCSRTHLTSDVGFEDRRVDIDIKVHPLLQHADDSLELGDISQDLQGEQHDREQGFGETKVQFSVRSSV